MGEYAVAGAPYRNISSSVNIRPATTASRSFLIGLAWGDSWRSAHLLFPSPPSSKVLLSCIAESSLLFRYLFRIDYSVATLDLHYSMSFLTQCALAASFVAPLAWAQTFTTCNPLNSTTCPIDTALGTNHTWDFTTGSADSTWNVTDGNIVYGSNGAEFTIANKGDAPTIQTNFYIFGGEIETWLKASPGQGMSHHGSTGL